ncbi:MAG: biopolymer transporter ExbD [Myxococcaceae bacterium]
MAFAVGGPKKKGAQPAMNVTPLVDVVLVLLIIFMVITPLMTKHVWMRVPVKDDVSEPPPPADDPTPPVVLTLKQDGSVLVNKDTVSREELANRLARIFSGRADQVLFFDAEDDVAYDDAMQVLDLARNAVKTVAVLPERPAS